MTAKIGLAGCGYWGVNLLRNFNRLGALSAITDANPQQAAKLSSEFNVRNLSWEAMLADPEIKGIALATPAETHADMAIAAMRAGKHCYVEKPLALNEADALSMIDASVATNRVLMVGHLLQYHPAFVALRNLVKEGGLGKLRYVYSHRLSLGKLRTEENALWSFAPHDISMILALFDQEPIEVTGFGDSYITNGIDDWNRVEMRFKDGGSAHVFASWLHPFKEHRLTVVGEKAMAVFEDSAVGAGKLRLYRHRLDASGKAPVLIKSDAEPIAYGTEEPLLQECQHFVDCVTTSQKPQTDSEEALRVLRVMVKASV